MSQKKIIHFIERNERYACNKEGATIMGHGTKLWFRVTCKNCMKADHTLDKKQNIATLCIVVGFFVLTASLLFKEQYSSKILYGIVCVTSFIVMIIGVVNFGPRKVTS